MNIGIPELLIVLAVVLLILGPKRLPRLGRQLGGGFRELRDGLRKHQDDDEPPPAPRAAEPEVLDGEVIQERKP